METNHQTLFIFSTLDLFSLLYNASQSSEVSAILVKFSIFIFFNSNKPSKHYLLSRNSESTDMKDVSASALASTNDSLSVAIEELKNKEKGIESLKMELQKAEELELSQKETSFHKLKDEMNMVKSLESESVESLYEDQKERINELDKQMNKRKESEKKIYNSLVAQSKEFEQVKISLEESRKRIRYLLAKLQKWETQSMSSDHLKRLEIELQSTKEKLWRVEEDEQVSSIEAENLSEEIIFLKNELRSIAGVEENNKKAMDDLASAFKEVRTEAIGAKKKLSSTQTELEKTKWYAENSKMKLRMLEVKYNEAKKEADRFKNTSERLRIEAKESLMAWNTRQIGLVDCIRKAEDERNAAREETRQVLESFEQAKNLNKKAKEENRKLRDIIKHAINEANVAKEVANIVRAENSQLEDAIAEKDEALNFLSQENETLKNNKAAAYEIIRELKMLFCELRQ